MFTKFVNKNYVKVDTDKKYRPIYWEHIIAPFIFSEEFMEASGSEYENCCEDKNFKNAFKIGELFNNYILNNVTYNGIKYNDSWVHHYLKIDSGDDEYIKY